jgi:hypothetical protein
MNQPSLALVVLVLTGTAAYAQSSVRAPQLSLTNSHISETAFASDNSERAMASRSIAALQRLDKDVLVYRSLGDFEANGRLARVSFAAFQNDLQEVTAEIEPLLPRLAPGKLKSQITNALASYQDGAFWWQKIDQPRVVHVSALSANQFNSTPSDTAFLSSVPYTVAIHWRQANRYLKRAAQLIN